MGYWDYQLRASYDATRNDVIGVFAFGSGTTIGGTTVGARNVISGNNGAGVDISGDHVVVQGNYLGTDSSGTVANPAAAASSERRGSGNSNDGATTGKLGSSSQIPKRRTG